MYRLPDHKVCKDCGIVKPISDYYLREKTWAYSYCKACHLVRTNASRERNRENINAKMRARYRKNHHVKNAYYRLRRYGLTPADYAALFARQDDRCPICTLPLVVEGPRDGGHWTSWELPSVDHDHDTGAVRGILHRRCNLALEFLPSDEELARARAYLAQGDFRVEDVDPAAVRAAEGSA